MAVKRRVRTGDGHETLVNVNCSQKKKKRKVLCFVTWHTPRRWMTTHTHTHACVHLINILAAKCSIAESLTKVNLDLKQLQCSSFPEGEQISF